jgi:putative sterol carrier protein
MSIAREFFETLAERVPPEKAAGVTNTYLFEIADAGTWRVAVDDGKIDVTEGDGAADVTFAMSEETLHKLLLGQQNPTTGVLTGKIKVRGDMAAATRLKSLFGR